MIAYEELLESNVMDMRYVLPTVPRHLNPHLYCAYAVRVVEATGDLGAGDVLRERYETAYLSKCEKAAGMITLSPNGGGASHDEAYGAAFLNSGYAGRLIDLLNRTDGIFSDAGTSEAKNVYRFGFFVPAVRAWANTFRVGLWSQFCFIAALLFHMAFTKPGEVSGHLLLWLPIPRLKEKVLVRIFISIWARHWEKRGMTPKVAFSKHYLTESPWFGRFASDRWAD